MNEQQITELQNLIKGGDQGKVRSFLINTTKSEGWDPTKEQAYKDAMANVKQLTPEIEQQVNQLKELGVDIETIKKLKDDAAKRADAEKTNEQKLGEIQKQNELLQNQLKQINDKGNMELNQLKEVFQQQIGALTDKWSAEDKKILDGLPIDKQLQIINKINTNQSIEPPLGGPNPPAGTPGTSDTQGMTANQITSMNFWLKQGYTREQVLRFVRDPKNPANRLDPSTIKK